MYNRYRRKADGQIPDMTSEPETGADGEVPVGEARSGASHLHDILAPRLQKRDRARRWQDGVGVAGILPLGIVFIWVIIVLPTARYSGVLPEAALIERLTESFLDAATFPLLAVMLLYFPIRAVTDYHHRKLLTLVGQNREAFGVDSLGLLARVAAYPQGTRCHDVAVWGAMANIADDYSRVIGEEERAHLRALRKNDSFPVRLAAKLLAKQRNFELD